MTARTFEDTSGAQWEVFEVHRSSHKSGTVSAGLEAGWLAFVNGETKRRLAPFPANWAVLSDAELARLCSSARSAPPARYPFERPLRPRIRRSSSTGELSNGGAPSVVAQPPLSDDDPSSASGAIGGEVELTVRNFAREARARELPVVEAMIELKAMLAQRHPEPESPARDKRRVRRWFVETYYFDKKR
jgi:hypothetical protein